MQLDRDGHVVHIVCFLVAAQPDIKTPFQGFFTVVHLASFANIKYSLTALKKSAIM
jgi:hypothetical protein